MKQLLTRLARYNAWANERIIEVLALLGKEQLDQEIESSFPSIRKTVAHVWGAEEIWMKRINGEQRPAWEAYEDVVDFLVLIGKWKISSAGFISLVSTLPEHWESAPIVTAYNMKGVLCYDPLDEVLQHVFNHSTYHRGQLVTMLRQLGVTHIPATDFIVFSRLSSPVR
jgi:uncharacterized damage-inducible protein DinB